MERNRLSGTLPRSLDVIRHNIFEMNFGNTQRSFRLAVVLGWLFGWLRLLVLEGPVLS